MRILQIVVPGDTLHIQFEAGQQGKNNMMTKINRFLTRELKRKISNAESEILQHTQEGDADILYHTIENLKASIALNQFKVAAVESVCRIEDYVTVTDVVITSHEVYQLQSVTTK